LKVRNDKKYGLSGPASEYQMGINSFKSKRGSNKTPNILYLTIDNHFLGLSTIVMYCLGSSQFNISSRYHQSRLFHILQGSKIPDFYKIKNFNWNHMVQLEFGISKRSQPYI